MPFTLEQETRIRQLLREELAAFSKSDRYVFEKGLQLLDGRNIQLGRNTGTLIGLSALEKMGFYGITPVTQQTGVAVSAAGIHAALVALGVFTA